MADAAPFRGGQEALQDKEEEIADTETNTGCPPMGGLFQGASGPQRKGSGNMQALRCRIG